MSTLGLTNTMRGSVTDVLKIDMLGQHYLIFVQSACQSVGMRQ